MLKTIDLLVMLLLSSMVISFLVRMAGSRFSGWRLGLLKACGALWLSGLLYGSWLIGRPGWEKLLLTAAFLFVWTYPALKEGADTRLFLSLLSISVIALSFCFGTLLISLVSGAGYEEILMSLTVWHFGLLLLVLLIFFYVARVLLRLADQSFCFGVRDFAFLLIMPVISVISVFVLLNLVPMVAADFETVQLVLIVLAGIVVINLLSYYFYVEMERGHETELKYVLLQKQYDFLQDSSGEIRHYYEEMGKLYHDFKRYLTVVLAYLEEEETQEAKDYIGQLVQMKSTFTHHRVFCDNNAVNYVLNFFLSRCTEKGIDCVCTVTASLSDVEDMDFCVILNNLLDNALEASEKEEKPCIRIEIEPEAEMEAETEIRILIMNRISQSVLEQNPRLETTKTERGFHGYGIGNVRELAKRYGGGVEHYEEGGFFCCVVTGGFVIKEKNREGNEQNKEEISERKEAQGRKTAKGRTGIHGRLFLALLFSSILSAGSSVLLPAVRLSSVCAAPASAVLENEEIKELAAGIIDWKKEQRGVKSYENLFSYPFVDNAGNAQGDWYAIGMGRFGYPDNYPAYLSAAADFVSQKYLTEQKLHSFKATEWHRLSLAVLAMGGDPACIGQDENGAPVNLIADGVYNRGNTISLGEQGVNGWIWGLLALDSLRYRTPEDSFDGREDIIAAILSAQLSDGMFAYYPGEGDVDITAMALQALAPYYNSRETYAIVREETGETVVMTVRQSVDEALLALSARQRADGDFYSWSTENVESTVQVLTALCTLGIDPFTDPRFIKEGNTLLDGILKYRMEDGGFCHSFQTDPNNPNTRPAESNSMASEQVLYGLCALYRYENRMRNLYDFREEMEPEARQAVLDAEEAIRLLPVSGNPDEREREEVRQAFAVYCQVPAGERSYVRNYARLAESMDALGMEDDSSYLSEAMEENRKGCGHVERIFREGSIENGLDVFTQADLAVYMELPSDLGTRYEPEVRELTEKLRKAANAMEYPSVETGLLEKQRQIDGVKEEIRELDRQAAEWLAKEEKAPLKLRDAIAIRQLIVRCEALDGYDREQVDGYEGLLAVREAIGKRTGEQLRMAAAAAAICLCVSGTWIWRRMRR